MQKKTIKGAATLILMLASTLSAEAEDIIFGGSVSTNCTINVTRQGTMTQNASARRIASGQPGGQHGLATITTTGYGFALAVDAPTAFSNQPSADVASPETFTAWTRGITNTVFAWSETAQTLNLGATDVRVRLAAQKAGQVSFANGDYAATVVLRCE